MAGSVELIKRADDKWAFRIKAPNGQIVAIDGGQGYESESDAHDRLEKAMGAGFSEAFLLRYPCWMRIDTSSANWSTLSQ